MISVCMTTYNGEKYLSKQIESVCDCLREKDEIIISDDGSTDGTLSILESFAVKDSRIRVLEGPRRGVIENFGNALAQARGQYLFLSDQDDCWRNDKVERVLDAFSSYGCGVVVHNARIIDEFGMPTGETLFEVRKSKPGFAKNLIKNSYVGCCMAFRSSLLPYVMPLPNYVEMHDWWIGLIAELVAKPCFLSDELIDYRRHDSNVSPMSHYRVSKMILNRIVLSTAIFKRMLSLRIKRR